MASSATASELVAADRSKDAECGESSNMKEVIGESADDSVHGADSIDDQPLQQVVSSQARAQAKGNGHAQQEGPVERDAASEGGGNCELDPGDAGNRDSAASRSKSARGRAAEAQVEDPARDKRRKVLDKVGCAVSRANSKDKANGKERDRREREIEKMLQEELDRLTAPAGMPCASGVASHAQAMNNGGAGSVEAHVCAAHDGNEAGSREVCAGGVGSKVVGEVKGNGKEEPARSRGKGTSESGTANEEEGQARGEGGECERATGSRGILAFFTRPAKRKARESGEEANQGEGPGARGSSQGKGKASILEELARGEEEEEQRAAVRVQEKSVTVDVKQRERELAHKERLCEALAAERDRQRKAKVV